MRRALAVVVALIFGLVAARARAQSAPDVRLQSDVSIAGVGDLIHVQLTANSADAMPSEPRLGQTPGFTVRGQSTFPSQQHIIVNGARTDRYTLVVDWELSAVRVGTFNLGPPSVVVSGARLRGQPLAIRVVPAGQAPARRPAPSQPASPFGFSPFDPWRGLFPDFGASDQAPPAPPAVVTDPKLSLDTPRGASFFLHATVDRAHAVVGEQLVCTVYAYIDTNSSVDENDVHEAAADDFVKHALLRDDQEPPLAGYASVGGHVWQVRLLRRWALFPLRSGDLRIGPMSVSVTGAHGASPSKRSSEELFVQVSEPPLSHRPPGYAIGDVGRFTMTARVEPRSIEEGAAVSVHVELSGTGNLPNALAVPVREGLEWLPPEVHDKVGPVGQDGYGGTRMFDFVVRAKRAGELDLGELTLPFWNPETRRYEVARADLGAVHVAPSASPKGDVSVSAEVLVGLPPSRDVLAGSISESKHLDDLPLFWLAAVAGAPLSFGVAVAGRAAQRRAAHAWRHRTTSPLVTLKQRLAAARAACDGGDSRAADAAVARALEAAIVAHAGISIRGAVGAEVVSRLEGAGVAPDAASRVAELLRECEVARFSPGTADGVAVRERWTRVQGAIRGLEKAG